MNFFKDEINQISAELQATVKQASGELNEIVRQAGDGLQEVVRQAGEEFGKQRTLTKSDMQDLIQFALQELNASVDARLLSAQREARAFSRWVVRALLLGFLSLLALIGLAAIILK